MLFRSLRAAEKKILTLQSKSEADQKKKLEVFLHNRGFGWQEMQTVLKQFFPAGSEDDEEFG